MGPLLLSKREGVEGKGDEGGKRQKGKEDKWENKGREEGAGRRIRKRRQGGEKIKVDGKVGYIAEEEGKNRGLKE